MMQDVPLLVPQILEHAARYFGDVPVISQVRDEDRVHRYCYADAAVRARQLAAGLRELGVRPGDRVATMAWNTHRHLEAWYAIAGLGAICHTVNPRLFEAQIRYIMNHAEDSTLLVDPCFVPLLEGMYDRLPSLRRVIVLCDREHLPATSIPDVISYEDLIAGRPESFDWPDLDESSPSSLCYTSGTTGDPKGVLYTHRSSVLVAMNVAGKGSLAVCSGDAVLMIVPMYHANSWGLAYSCPLTGAKLILPGAKLDAKSLVSWIQQEQITYSAAVPTIWKTVLDYLQATGQQVGSLQEVTIGGTAVPRWMIETFDRLYGVQVVHAWGMTETSPLATVGRLTHAMRELPYEQQVEMRLKQGPPVFGASLKIVDDQGQSLPHDGQTMGRLMIKGPWVVQRYYKAEQDAVDAEGWLDTGDIATIDSHGFMQITDRAKDLIKSGGEWISSVELENIAGAHPDVQLVGVIAMPDEKWDERPLMIVKRVPNSSLTAASLQTFLKGNVAKWWLPEEVRFAEEIPLTAAGKIDKRALRRQHLDDWLAHDMTASQDAKDS